MDYEKLLSLMRKATSVCLCNMLSKQQRQKSIFKAFYYDLYLVDNYYYSKSVCQAQEVLSIFQEVFHKLGS